MVLFCCVAVKIREKHPPKKQSKMSVVDFRKADPTYVCFKPTTVEEAIDLFYRHKRLGVPVHLWPEVFVECSAHLKDSELDKFSSWLINPAGKPTGIAELKGIGETNDRLRKQLLEEAIHRDRMNVDEEKDSSSLVDVMEDLMIDDYINGSSAIDPSYEDFAMLE